MNANSGKKTHAGGAVRPEVVEQQITDTLERNYMPYAMSVIVSRAIPEIDGFKPSHRKLLYTMYSMGLLTGQRTKSANVVGQTMKLNPHGDMAIYETLVRLTKGYDALVQPYIDSKGNFGKHYSRDMQSAAPRYTEVKLEKVCEEIFRDLDKDAVDFVDNYDGTMKEPVLLPATFPSVLVNANQGIAVGMASNICSFNLQEVCDAAIGYIHDGDADVSQFMKAPDFSTGGLLIYDKGMMDEIYRTGRGSFKIRARYRVDKKSGCVEIYEIPYMTSAEEIIDATADLVKAGKLRDINDIRDETDLNGLKITIDIKKTADADALMMRLLKLTPLESSFTCNFNILIGGIPKVLGVGQILKEWLAFRMGCVKRQLKHDIAVKSDKLHLLAGLKLILLDIDKAIRIIRNTGRDEDVVPALMEGFGIDRRQAEFVAEIKLRNLNKEYILHRTGEYDAIKKGIEDLKLTLADENKIKKIIVRQLQEVAKKYGRPRRTEIIYEHEAPAIDREQLIEDYNLKLFLTEQNYLKKIPLVSLRVSPEHKLKDGDSVMQEFETHNRADLLFFSDRCAVYKIKVHEIEDCKASSLGEYLANLLRLEADERIIYMTATDNYSGFFLFTFANGKIAKIPLESYSTKTNRKKLANAYSDASKLVKVIFMQQDADFVAYSSIGKALVFNTSLINSKSTRDSQGVQVLKEKKGSVLIDLKPVDASGIKEPEYYRSKGVPAIGCYLRPEDKTDLFTQTSLV